MQSPLSCRRIPVKPLALAAVALALAGCSTPHPAGYYDVSHDTTETDAQHVAQGRSTAQAPSQLQFGFNSNASNSKAEKAPESAATPALPQALAKAKTFLGTVPCLSSNNQCPAQRITLTVAPTGEWRARTQYLDASAADTPLVQQGCWTITGSAPLRIMLATTQGATKGSFVFINDHVLRVSSLNGQTPSLDYRLTEQADVDPIDELPANTPLQCP
jgi:hypothetical protein